MELAELEKLETIFLIGSDIRREQPLACHRVRKAALNGAEVFSLNPIDYSLNFDLSSKLIVPSQDIPLILAGIAKYFVDKNDEIDPSLQGINPLPEVIELAKRLEQKTNGILLLGIHAISHPQASLIRALAEYIAAKCDMSVGCLSEGANAAGAWLAGMIPHRGPAGSIPAKKGFNALEMFAHGLKSYLLLNVKPELDCINSADAMSALMNADFNVVMTPFVTDIQEQYANVLLPITPFFEGSGTFINATNHWQKFEAVTRPLGDAKYAWKVLRVLGNLFNLEGFDYLDLNQMTAELKYLMETPPSLTTSLMLKPDKGREKSGKLRRLSEWPMNQIDNLVRRAIALQEWSQQESLVCARINGKVANDYGIQSGELISVVQGETQLNLPVIIDNRIAGDYILIPAGIPQTAGFGEHMAPIDLLRSEPDDRLLDSSCLDNH